MEIYGGVAHLARALAWHARGSRFKSDHLHKVTVSIIIIRKPFFILNHFIKEPTTTVSAPSGKKMAWTPSSANGGACKECSGRARLEGSVQVRSSPQRNVFHNVEAVFFDNYRFRPILISVTIFFQAKLIFCSPAFYGR